MLVRTCCDDDLIFIGNDVAVDVLRVMEPHARIAVQAPANMPVVFVRDSHESPGESALGMRSRRCQENDSIRIGDEVQIHVNKLRGRRVKIAIEAPQQLFILFERKSRRDVPNAAKQAKTVAAAAIVMLGLVLGCGPRDVAHSAHRVDTGLDTRPSIVFECCQPCGSVPVIQPPIDPQDYEFVPQPTLAPALEQ